MSKGGVIAGALLLFAALEALAFYVPLYGLVLDPNSSTGSFESAKHALAALPADSGRDVLVVGDSRIYSGLSPSIADAATQNRLRFLNGGIPGTTPRCWYYYLNAIDPKAKRFRAIVIPVDTYLDSDSAIGSLDGDQRQADLHYLVFTVAPTAIPKLATSFPDMRMQFTTGVTMLLRGPVLRDDVQAALLDPSARIQAIRRGQQAQPYDPLAAHPLDASLAGTRVDFGRGAIAYPASVSRDERSAIADQVLRVHHYSASYARYRQEWIYPIVDRYVRAGVPVIFVRIPTQPAHDRAETAPAGSLGTLAQSHSAFFLDAKPYTALERPDLFGDHDHLNRAGSALFSAQLGRDVSRLLPGDGGPALAPVPDVSSSGSAFHAGAALKQWIGVGIPLEFQSYEFWIFVAVLVALFYASPHRLRRYVLLVASYYFYARWNGWYVVFLLTLTVSDFAIALLLQRTFGRARRALLAAGIAANLAFLGTFKYANFTTGTVAALLAMHQDPWLVSWIVPIGISFHTFQSISYLADVSRGKTPAIRDPIDYALYLAFFPQLLSGPIVRAGLFFGELFHWKAPAAEDVSYACMRITFGLFKKLAVADQFGSVVDAYFKDPTAHPGAPAAWGVMFAFSMQIFFDFSGYTDIAIGLARLFGFVFPENFNLPYLATSVTEFWHRWHMTLSTWLRDYLYIPLGGGRGGSVQTIRNLMLTMLLGGLWHGAQWTFVAWGALHGIALSIERITGYGRAAPLRTGAGRALQVLATFTAVTLAWVLFRAQGFGQALTIYRALVSGGPGASVLGPWCSMLAAGLIVFAVVRLVAGDKAAALTWARLPRFSQAAMLCALLIGVETLSLSGSTAIFIYFKF